VADRGVSKARPGAGSEGDRDTGAAGDDVPVPQVPRQGPSHVEEKPSQRQGTTKTTTNKSTCPSPHFLTSTSGSPLAHEQANYPFAIVGINLTLLLIDLLALREQKYLTTNARYWSTFEDDAAFFELFCIAFLHMDHIWAAQGAVRTDFGRLIGEVKGALGQVRRQRGWTDFHGVFIHVHFRAPVRLAAAAMASLYRCWRAPPRRRRRCAGMHKSKGSWMA